MADASDIPTSAKQEEDREEEDRSGGGNAGDDTLSNGVDEQDEERDGYAHGGDTIARAFGKPVFHYMPGHVSRMNSMLRQLESHAALIEAAGDPGGTMTQRVEDLEAKVEQLRKEALAYARGK